MPRWTPESRAKQAQKIRQWRPWEQSTGPTSEAGKSRSRENYCGYWDDAEGNDRTREADLRARETIAEIRRLLSQF